MEFDADAGVAGSCVRRQRERDARGGLVSADSTKTVALRDGQPRALRDGALTSGANNTALAGAVLNGNATLAEFEDHSSIEEVLTDAPSAGGRVGDGGE